MSELDFSFLDNSRGFISRSALKQLATSEDAEVIQRLNTGELCEWSAHETRLQEIQRSKYTLPYVARFACQVIDAVYRVYEGQTWQQRKVDAVKVEVYNRLVVLYDQLGTDKHIGAVNVSFTPQHFSELHRDRLGQPTHNYCLLALDVCDATRQSESEKVIIFERSRHLTDGSPLLRVDEDAKEAVIQCLWTLFTDRPVVRDKDYRITLSGNDVNSESGEYHYSTKRSLSLLVSSGLEDRALIVAAYWDFRVYQGHAKMPRNPKAMMPIQLLADLGLRPKRH